MSPWITCFDYRVNSLLCVDHNLFTFTLCWVGSLAFSVLLLHSGGLWTCSYSFILSWYISNNLSVFGGAEQRTHMFSFIMQIFLKHLYRFSPLPVIYKDAVCPCALNTWYCQALIFVSQHGYTLTSTSLIMNGNTHSFLSSGSLYVFFYEMSVARFSYDSVALFVMISKSSLF